MHVSFENWMYKNVLHKSCCTNNHAKKATYFSFTTQLNNLVMMVICQSYTKFTEICILQHENRVDI